MAVLAMLCRSVGETPRVREVRWMEQMRGRRRGRQYPDGRRGSLLGRSNSVSGRASCLASVMSSFPTLQQMRRVASLKAPVVATRVGTRARVVE